MHIRIGSEDHRELHIMSRHDGKILFDLYEDPDGEYSKIICSDVSEAQARRIVAALVFEFPSIGTVALDPVEQVLSDFGMDPSLVAECAEKIAAAKEAK